MARIPPIVPDYDGSEATVRGQRPSRNIRKRRKWGVGGADVTAPTRVSIVVPAAGTTIIITYNEALDETSTPVGGAYTIGATYPTTVSSVVVSGSTVTLTTNQELIAGDTVTLSYTAGGSPVQDLAGNDAPNFATQAATNNSTVVLETAVETLLTGTSWTPPFSGSVVVEGWGGGGAGLVLIGGGGGPEYARLNAFAVTKGSAVSFALGAAGAAPSGNGGATTWNSTSLVANGGTGAVGAGGAGGTGGTGDVTFNGGAGVSGAGNTSGGGGAGSAGAGSTSTPGAPDGGATVAGGAGTNLAGGGSSGASSFSGSPGRIRLTYVRPRLAGYPWIRAMSFGRDVANATSRGVTIPGTHTAGDLLLYCVASDGPVASLDIAGTTPLIETEDGTATVCLGVYVVDSSASPPATIASASEQVNWCVIRIAGTGGAAACLATAATATSTNADPPLVTQAASKPSIYFTPIAWDSSGAGITALSTSYTPTLIVPLETNSGGVQLALAALYETSASNNPAATSTGNQEWVAATVAVPAP